MLQLVGIVVRVAIFVGLLWLYFLWNPLDKTFSKLAFGPIVGFIGIISSLLFRKKEIMKREIMQILFLLLVSLIAIIVYFVM